MQEKMKYAPIMIPTLCRDEYFIRCIESLKKNSWAKYTDIYIGLDYPKNDAHWEGYRKICDYLKGDFSEFKNFKVFKRKTNVGVIENFDLLIAEIFKIHDRFIYVEDDLELSINFIEYMDKCLYYYEDEPDIVAINGYSYPLPWRRVGDSNVFLCNYFCLMWGAGFWKDSFLEISKALRNNYIRSTAKTMFKNKNYRKLINRELREYITGILDYTGYTLCDGFTDIATGIYLSFENKYVVVPILSKVKNYGFDGSGLTCADTRGDKEKFNYLLQKIDKSKNFLLKPNYNKDCSYNKNLMNKFEKICKLEMIKVNIKLIMIRIFGVEFCKKILKIKNSLK